MTKFEEIVSKGQQGVAAYIAERQTDFIEKFGALLGVEDRLTTAEKYESWVIHEFRKLSEEV